MMNKALLLFSLATMSTVAGAQQAQLNGAYVLQYDSELDGEVLNPVSQEYNFKGHNRHFVAQLASVVLSGETNIDGQLIHFKISEPALDLERYYTGKASSVGFSGTWYSNQASQGDWRIDTVTTQGQSCREILDAGLSTGDGMYEIVTAEGQALTVYCDMTRDGGGWTLVGSYPKGQPGGVKRIADYGDVPAQTPNDPSRLWLYQGSLSAFTDAKEQISCSTAGCTDGKSAYATNLPTTHLELIRYSWGHQDRIEHMPQRRDIPACQKTLSAGATVYEGCSHPNYLNYAGTDTIVGWQGDVNGDYCWVARGTYKPGSLGSGICSRGSEPNGTQWALLWMR
ncbi:fibrinogen-like YCDxxxxGGGW domain-containing protein [Pseudoalteromonas rubra]|uniref:fibrinogen-like YCDxxxxGGGW domain-containing protein n=1 Tax=Pseudoalteromonas rubra TaxID=43658 RepID=UPI000F7982DB|nr:fibrinogen-like YCDxxxxGGGW domain-containing protein [Pseudoalteromonas rubra]